MLKITRKLVETKEKPPKSIVETVKGREAIYIAQSVYATATDVFRESRVAAKKRFRRSRFHADSVGVATRHTSKLAAPAVIFQVSRSRFRHRGSN